ncbi:endonuclease/exonuclease/phosphatase family protein [Lacihabitans sp. LS3-19]|uniref:endonuclease/exonuclease/phosphatase family protein n=1 Tax=Lacihabitans sp. LS3-19 TaxID=2487335 RepID=UPI0020CF9E4F|nr:endonuclease/exonuclease/phosphatase family protein [Lacihabitans sp. LS3-19]MCP9769366.1 endonuclease/exonuclease/phosphatase family protein [Lacihabitans sp. LS3-19]
MKIITWNCQGAFRKKAKSIFIKNPDITIIQECENLEKLNTEKNLDLLKNQIWIGDNKHKGLGIFSNEKYILNIHQKYNPDLKYIVPVIVKGDSINFTLFAIWANNKEDKDGQYVEQVWKAINYYEKLLENELVILTGDFNSNTIWDKPSRIGNHSDVVEKLSTKAIHSIYHKHLNQTQGKEEHPTFYLYKNKNKPYHIDYAFVSLSMFEKLIEFEVGTYEDWIAISDHSPLIMKFDY